MRETLQGWRRARIKHGAQFGAQQVFICWGDKTGEFG
jgi:hypothetical protein